MEIIAHPSAQAAMSGRFLCSLALLLLSFAGGGCEQQSQSPAGLPVVKMDIGRQKFAIEVARSAGEQETGLMKRDAMPADHGMIFVFADDQVRRFWMKNTRFPLDILFLDSTGKVVSVRQMQAYDMNETSSDFPARYAVELNSGAAAQSGVQVGDILDIPPPARSSK
jgi:uncharacterized membrane protein (UPF0127 family)